jgi:hypothetical protein
MDAFSKNLQRKTSSNKVNNLASMLAPGIDASRLSITIWSFYTLILHRFILHDFILVYFILLYVNHLHINTHATPSLLLAALALLYSVFLITCTGPAGAGSRPAE